MTDSIKNSTEEIVAKIKEGHTECYRELWLNLEKLIRRKARYFAEQTETEGFIDDMMQEAFLVLPSAVEYYDEKNEKSFAGVLSGWFLPKAFKTACYGGVSEAAFKKPLNNAISIYTPILKTDVDEITILDTLIDADSQTGFEGMEDQDFWLSIGQYLRKGIGLLHKPDQRTLLLWLLESNDTISEAHRQQVIGNKSRSWYREVFRKGCLNLGMWMKGKGRAEAIKTGLDDYIGTSGFYAGGLSAFREHNFTSNVEMIVLRSLAREEQARMRAEKKEARARLRELKRMAGMQNNTD